MDYEDLKHEFINKGIFGLEIETIRFNRAFSFNQKYKSKGIEFLFNEYKGVEYHLKIKNEIYIVELDVDIIKDMDGEVYKIDYIDFDFSFAKNILLFYENVIFVDNYNGELNRLINKLKDIVREEEYEKLNAMIEQDIQSRPIKTNQIHKI